MPAVSLPTDLRVDGARLLRRLDELAEVGPITGANGERGSARLALSASTTSEMS
jgi:hypothetical protein